MLRAAQDLLQRLTPREFVYELVEVADLSHQWVVDLLYLHSAHDACDERGIRVQRRVGKELRERRPVRETAAQRRLVEAGQPSDDLVEFRLRATLAFDLREVVRIDRGDGVRKIRCSMA